MRPFAWHGLVCLLPDDWSPLKLEGDARRGFVVFADLQRTRLELRWHRLGKPPADAEAVLRSAVARAAGMTLASQARLLSLGMADAPALSRPSPATVSATSLRPREALAADDKCAAGEAALCSRDVSADRDVAAGESDVSDPAKEVSRPGGSAEPPVAAIYLEDDPPYRRDYAALYFPRTQRLLELVYPLRRRERVLEEKLLPTFYEVADGHPCPWAVFELSCLTPPAYRLERHRLNAGDLSLFFRSTNGRWGGRRGWMSVRQVAVASLALQRTKLFGWLRAMQRPDDRLYRAALEAEPVELEVATRRYVGLRLPMRRRRRFGWMRWLPESCVTLGCHDVARDRLVVVHGTDELVVRQLAATVGLSVGPPSPRRSA